MLFGKWSGWVNSALVLFNFMVYTFMANTGAPWFILMLPIGGILIGLFLLSSYVWQFNNMVDLHIQREEIDSKVNEHLHKVQDMLTIFEKVVEDHPELKDQLNKAIGEQLSKT